MEHHEVHPGQLSILPDQAHARRGDPQTSWDAARSVESTLRRSQLAVWHVLEQYGPLTDHRLVATYDSITYLPRQSPSGIRTRRRELTDAGFVYDTGAKVVLESGRKAILWAAVPADATDGPMR